MRDGYDVIIAGGGLAGLCLALQLRRDQSALRIAVLERDNEQPSDAIHKVGESTVEIAGWYLAEYLGLRDDLFRRHFQKNGLRFFMPAPGGAAGFARRTEIGPVSYAKVPTFQLDRGRLERDLRDRLAGDAQLTFYNGASVKDFVAGHDLHTITFRFQGEERILRARWFVDATGRRRFLQRKYGFGTEADVRTGAAWFRMPGRIDAGELSSDPAYRAEDPDNIRYYSTNHLMGEGYWVWLIPLSSGITSIGIVTDTNIHPAEVYNKSERALAWLEAHEPSLYARIAGTQILDFHALKSVAYASSAVSSEERWACTGEAAFFLDPLYSPGSDFIALLNLQIGAMISGRQSPAAVNATGQYFFQLWSHHYRDTYEVFRSARAFAAKLYWDTTLYWTVFTPAVITGAHLAEDFHERTELEDALLLQRNVQAMLRIYSRHVRNDDNPRRFYYPPQTSYLAARQAGLAQLPAATPWLDELTKNVEWCAAVAAGLARRVYSEIPDHKTELDFALEPRFRETIASAGAGLIAKQSEADIAFMYGELDAVRFQVLRGLMGVQQQMSSAAEA